MTFTTEPLFRRCVKRGAFISQNRLLDFMLYLWNLHLKKCSYETLKFEFIRFSGTNDSRTVERYIGRPEEIVYSRGTASTVRMNRNSGKIAQFEYSNVKRVPAKQGLAQTLGYITLKPEELEIVQDTVILRKKTKNWIAILHHEKMDYYTKQTVLESANSTLELVIGSDSLESNDNLCVSSLLVKNDSSSISDNSSILPRGRARETAFGTGVSTKETMETVVEKKEEEDIENTHTNQSSESEQSPKVKLATASEGAKNG